MEQGHPGRPAALETARPLGWAHERVHPAGSATTGCCCPGETRQDIPGTRCAAGRDVAFPSAHTTTSSRRINQRAVPDRMARLTSDVSYEALCPPNQHRKPRREVAEVS